MKNKLSPPLTAFILTAIAASIAYAQSPTQIEQLIVTGTRAKDRTELTTPTPVDILTQADLVRAAGPGGDLGVALQTLLPSFSFPKQSNSSGADHVRAAQLRGMSPDQVLVLINGKRRHTSAIVNLDSKIGKGTNPVDFNSIPISAIKRVEVLRDGAGAQYGSDAVAGVINVILENATGGELTLGYGAHNTKFEPTNERISDGDSPEARARYGFALNRGFVTFGADVSRRDATNRAGFDQIPFFEEQTPDNLALAGKRNYKAGDSKVANTNLWINAQELVGGSFDAYGFAMFNRRESIGTGFFRYPDSFANIKSVYPNGYRPETTGENTDLSAVAGFRGVLASAWSFDASLGYGRNDFDYGVRRSLNASLGAQSPTSFHLGDFAFDQLTANFDLSREVNLAGGKPMTLALGGELRRDGFKTSAGDPASYAVGGNVGAPIGAQAGPGLQPIDAVKKNRTVFGVYADLSGDVAKTLFANAAVRYDRYSDFGDAFTAKLSGRLELSKEFALRAAISNNFRAPSLAQSAFSFTTTAFGDGGSLSSVRTIPVDGVIGRALGLPELKAEKSTNLSAGLTLAPNKSISATLDAYRINLRDRITISERFSGETLTNTLATTLGLQGVDGINFFANAVDTRTDGVDLVASWNGAAAGGNLRLSLASSWSKTKLREIKATPARLVALGLDRTLVGLEEQNTLTTAAPDARHVFTMNWSNARFGTQARITRHGKTTRVFDFGDGFTPTQTYGAKTQLDLEFEYKPTKQISFAIGGNNITDQYPTRSIDDITYFGNLPYDVLSPIGFNGAFYYARLQYKF
jgi:iron complex outermembrane recepter protein